MEHAHDLLKKDLLERDLLEKGFQLAYFVFPDRQQAIRILSGALEKLSVQVGRETRRDYWRHKHLKRGITRITREQADALQWLILYESDSYEVEQESRGQQAPEHLAVRYVKSLVRSTTAMSAFYVNVGLHRLLHNYSTLDVQRVYETVTDRYLGADEYRRAKAVLMAKLERRFGERLRTSRTQHGELRFEPWEDQQAWAALVDLSLQTFTPWSTAGRCPVPADFGPYTGNLPPQLTGGRGTAINADVIEINRCHAFIDPACYARLARALDLDPPQERLALPRFYMEKEMKHNSGPAPAPLTEEERKTINDRLSSQAERRQAAAKSIRVLVDGRECLRLDAGRPEPRSVAVEEGAELVEIRAGHDDNVGENLLLGTHRIAYVEAQGIAPSHAVVRIAPGKKLRLEVIPGPAPAADQPHRASLNLSFHGWAIGRSQRRQIWPIAQYGLAALVLLGIGWLIGIRTTGPVANPAKNTQIAMVPISPTPAAGAQAFQDNSKQSTRLSAAFKSYRLVPDEEIVRSGGGPGFPSVALPGRPFLLRLELPLPPPLAAKTLRATLGLFGSPKAILSQTLRYEQGARDRVLVLWVPTSILQRNQDYSVTLRAAGANGKEEDVASFSFKTVPGTDDGNSSQEP